MSEASIRGVTLNYATYGSEGPWVALTPGSRRSFGEFVPFAEQFARSGYQVLLHDRRNCGRSEVAIEARGSESEIWADDLYELARHVGAGPLYVGGASAGARLAILFALRHPDALRGLLLWRVTGGSFATGKLAEAYYGAFIKVAEAGGMAAVCETEHFGACIAARPGNRDRLMQMDPAAFIRIMAGWREDFLRSAALPVVGATEAQLRSVQAPACIIAGNDRVHTPEGARNVARLLPRSAFHDGVVERREGADLLEQWDQAAWRQAEPKIAAIFTGFMQRVERERR